MHLISDNSTPGGFRIEGPFQALNGVDVTLSLGFTATSLSGESFRQAGATLLAASVYGVRPGEENAAGSVVRLTEIVSARETEARGSFDIFLDANGSDNAADRIFLDPGEFGTSVRVSQRIELTSVQSDGGSIAALSIYVSGFGVVPAPATLVLMIISAPAVLGRMRRKRGL